MNESNNEPKSYLNQLKKQVFGQNEKSDLYKKEQEIFENLSKEKELPKGEETLEINTWKNENLSAYDKLKKISLTKTEDEKSVETKTKNEYEHKFVENEDIKEMTTDGKTISYDSPRKDSTDIDWLKQEVEKDEVKKQEFKKEDNTKKWETKITSDNITNEKNSISFNPHKWETKEELPKQKPHNETIQAKTNIDSLFGALDSYKTAEVKELALYAKMTESEAETILKLFEENDIVELNYPTSLSKGPSVTLKNPLEEKKTPIIEGKILDSYEILIDKVNANISIILDAQENRPTYCINTPSIGPYTKKVLDFVKSEIAESTLIELEEILDPKKTEQLKEKFFEESKKYIDKYFGNTEQETKNILGGIILHEMYGLGEIEVLIGDDMLEEIALNSAKTPIAVYHKIHGWMKTNILPGTEEDITNFASQIGRKVGREITTLSPILDAHLLTGDRVNATLFPISAEGNTITIRRFARKPWTLIDFIGKSHTMNSEMAALLWLAMQYEMNILIAGGTASGKTSALNTLLSLVPSYHRIISIEDVREIVLPKYLDWNWIPMITRSPNPEGLGEVTMLELMLSSLRMRPDRIIVGEIRRKKEAEVLMEAIETGHSIYSTMHANSAYQVLRRLAEPPMNIPLMQIELIDLIVVQFRDRKTNKRRTYEISEIEQTSTGKGLQVNTIYKWVPRSDTWEKLNKPNKLLTLLNMHTGLTEDEIINELDEREKILEWMKINDITDIDMIGFIVKTFYASPEKVKKMAKQNTKATEIKKMMQESGDFSKGQ